MLKINRINTENFGGIVKDTLAVSLQYQVLFHLKEQLSGRKRGKRQKVLVQVM